MHQQTDGLQAMAHDVLRLVRVALLMEQLHAGHLLAALGGFDAVTDQHECYVPKISGCKFPFIARRNTWVGRWRIISERRC
jgi:hypothetical protein